MESVEPPRARNSSGLRVPIEAIVWGVLACGVIVVFALQAVPSIGNAVVRSGFPYANNQWTESPLMLQFFRMSRGQPAYTSTLLSNSYFSGSLYVFAIGTLGKVLGRADVVSLRSFSMALGLLSAVPLAFAAIAIARRAGVEARDGTAAAVCATAAATLGIAILSRCITFDTLHPDNLEYTLVATALALYYALAAGWLPARFVLLLPLTGVALALTEYSTVWVVPALLAALAATRAITLRAFGASLIAQGVALVGLLIVMPTPVRAWSVLVPAAHLWAFTPAKIADGWTQLTYWERFLSLSYVGSIPALYLLWKRRGREAVWIDGAALFVVTATALGGYFKQVAIWNTLTLLSAVTVPYVAAALGILCVPRSYTWTGRALAAATLLVLLALGGTLRTDPKQLPDGRVTAQMESARALARQLCATKATLLVTVLPDAFFACRTARYAIDVSFDALAAAYPRYYIGPTVFDLPTDAEYIVVNGSRPLPNAWIARYGRVVKTLPVVAGWGANYFPFPLKVYERN